MSIKDELRSQKACLVFDKMYGSNFEEDIKRYELIYDEFVKKFGDTNGCSFFSSPGRTEVIGNHTDHNLGKVVGASINMDSIGIARIIDEERIYIKSLSFDQDFYLDLADLEPKRYSGTIDLVRGMIQAFKEKGYNYGGFEIVLTSSVVASAGVSSSASFEMLILTVLNDFYNDSKLSVVELATCGKYAENNYWKKGSGLLDQIACGYGGLISIDFLDPVNPTIKKMNHQPLLDNYDFLIVSTGENHANLSEEYSSLPNEMKAVAHEFGQEVLRGLTREDILSHARELRKTVGDRAILRSIHFVEENKRVESLVKCLDEGDFVSALNLIRDSGLSSWKYLQNCVNNAKPSEQGITLTLMMTELYLNDLGSGTCRVHGGGFAGVILVVLPKGGASDYINYISKYQDYPIYKIKIRPYGAVNVSKLL